MLLAKYLVAYLPTRNRKHRRVATKPVACAKPLILSTVRREGGICVGKKGVRESKVGKEVGRDEGRARL